MFDEISLKERMLCSKFDHFRAVRVKQLRTKLFDELCLHFLCTHTATEHPDLSEAKEAHIRFILRHNEGD